MLFTDYESKKSWKKMSLLDGTFFVLARTIKPDQTRKSKCNYNLPLIFRIRRIVKWVKSMENELFFVISLCPVSPAPFNLWYGHSIPFDGIWTLNIRSKILILYTFTKTRSTRYLFCFVWKCANLRKLQLEMVELFFFVAVLAIVEKSIEHVNFKSFDILLLLPLILYLFCFPFFFFYSFFTDSVNVWNISFSGLFVMSGLDCIENFYFYFFFVCQFPIHKSLQMPFTFFKHHDDVRRDWKSMTTSVRMRSLATIVSTYAIVK